jgi:hypothetical protein
MDYLAGIALLLFFMVVLFVPPYEIRIVIKVLCRWNELSILQRITAVSATIIISPALLFWPWLIYTIYMVKFQQGPIPVWGLSEMGMVGTPLFIISIIAGLLLFLAMPRKQKSTQTTKD